MLDEEAGTDPELVKLLYLAHCSREKVCLDTVPISIHFFYHQIFRVWRKKRFDWFIRNISPTGSEVLLDVGGHPWFWTSHPVCVKRIDCLNISLTDWNAKTTEHNIHTFVGDGCSLQIPDKTYDIGFSNSVIEHVGSWERQKRFAAEISRAAKALWVQTPAYGCPIEPHYLTPFVHYLPRWLQKKILRRGTLWGWLEAPSRQQIDAAVDSTRLIRRSEMQQLFPDCKILTERFFWTFPKSYVAVRRRCSN